MALSEALYMNMEQVDCPNCHITFAIMAKHDSRLRESGDSFYCPSGHPMSYPGAKKRKNLEQAIQELSQAKESLQWAKIQADRLKEELTKDKCPHCKERFKHLKAHIKRMHPNDES